MPLVVWKSRLDTCSRLVVHWQNCHNGFWKSLEKTQSATLGGGWPIMSGLVNAVACNKYWVDLAVSKTFTSFLPLCSVQNAIHVECRIVRRQWLVSGHCGLSRLGQRVTEQQFTHSSGSQVLLYLNISQHLGYFTSTYLNILATLPQHFQLNIVMLSLRSQCSSPTYLSNRPSPLLTIWCFHQ